MVIPVQGSKTIITKKYVIVIDIINDKARYNRIDAKYRQMAFRSVVHLVLA